MGAEAVHAVGEEEAAVIVSASAFYFLCSIFPLSPGLLLGAYVRCNT